VVLCKIRNFCNLNLEGKLVASKNSDIVVKIDHGVEWATEYLRPAIISTTDWDNIRIRSSNTRATYVCTHCRHTWIIGPTVYPESTILCVISKCGRPGYFRTLYRKWRKERVSGMGWLRKATRVVRWEVIDPSARKVSS
jgi:hypothetical protein